jgi:muramoyltetrapeptide carboxypeptidase
MIGSGYLPRWRGKILFLEDTNEDYYKIDRMMAQLQMAGVLKQISGFVFGQCTDCTPGGEGSSTEMLGSLGLIDILNHYIKPLGIPAWSGAMIGHMPNMFTLPEGLPVTINAAQGTITLLQPAVK